LLAPRNPNTNNHKDTTQVIQGAPQEKGRGWCANHTTPRAQKARINIQATEVQFRYVFCTNARIAIGLKFKRRKRIQEYTCITF
jgi:hypothetical protein